MAPPSLLAAMNAVAILWTAHVHPGGCEASVLEPDDSLSSPFTDGSISGSERPVAISTGSVVPAAQAGMTSSSMVDHSGLCATEAYPPGSAAWAAATAAVAAATAMVASPQSPCVLGSGSWPGSSTFIVAGSSSLDELESEVLAELSLCHR